MHRSPKQVRLVSYAASGAMVPSDTAREPRGGGRDSANQPQCAGGFGAQSYECTGRICVLKSDTRSTCGTARLQRPRARSRSKHRQPTRQQGRHRVQWFEMPESLFMALASCVVSISRRNLVMGEKSGLCGSRNAEASTSRSAAIYSLRLSHIRSGITGSPGSMVLSDIQTIEYATARDVRPLPPRKG